MFSDRSAQSGAGGSIMAGLCSMIGSEIDAYTHLLEEARRHAVDRTECHAIGAALGGSLAPGFGSIPACVANPPPKAQTAGGSRPLSPLPTRKAASWSRSTISLRKASAVLVPAAAGSDNRSLTDLARGITHAPVPTNASARYITRPAKRQPGEMCTPSSAILPSRHRRP